ncbi:MAG: alpha/beta fold hydrolase [Janthinobacterium lividum]
MPTVRTELLAIAYEEGGPADGPPVLLLHGWPDAARGWAAVAQRLQAAGWRTIIPYLRGTAPTQFLDPHTPRIGAGVALAQDAIDLLDALHLDQVAVVGHDWGARAAYTLAALFPERITAIATLALAYQPHGRFTLPGFAQSRLFWYQWFQCTEAGAAAVRQDPAGFARIQWDTWSPPGWFNEAEFAATAAHFNEPDWAAITLHAYRSRWLPGEATDPRYEALQQRLHETEHLTVPTLLIQGAADTCDAPQESEGLDQYFTAGYRRLLLEGVGHFPHREAPDAVATAILQLLASRD